MDIAKRLKELRLAQNLTTTELAKRCNLSQSLISKLENNLRTADVPTLAIICNALGITLSEFFTNSSELPPHIHELLLASRNLSINQIRSITEMIKELTS